MATSTFDTNIVLDEVAAEKLVDILNQPATPRVSLGDDFWKENERKTKEWKSLHSNTQLKPTQ